MTDQTEVEIYGHWVHMSVGLELRWVTSLILKRKVNIVPVDLPLCSAAEARTNLTILKLHRVCDSESDPVSMRLCVCVSEALCV